MDNQADGATEVERRARELFDASVERLDAQTRSRLNQARQAATAELQRNRRSPWFRWAPPAGALAAAALVAVMLGHAPGPGGVAPQAQFPAAGNPAEAVELLSAGDDLDLAKEDLAFYDWVEVDSGAPHGHDVG